MQENRAFNEKNKSHTNHNTHDTQNVLQILSDLATVLISGQPKGTDLAPEPGPAPLLEISAKQSLRSTFVQSTIKGMTEQGHKLEAF